MHLNFNNFDFRLQSLSLHTDQQYFNESIMRCTCHLHVLLTNKCQLFILTICSVENKLIKTVNMISKSVALQRGAGRIHSGTLSEITLYILRNHCTQFGALVHHVTIKTIKHQTTD